MIISDSGIVFVSDDVVARELGGFDGFCRRERGSVQYTTQF